MRKVWCVLCATLGTLAVAALAISLVLLHGVRVKQAALHLAESGVREDLQQSWGEGYENQAAEALFAHPEERDLGNDLAVYVSPEGIRFRSQSEAWGEEKLEMLYEELLCNQHGQELYALAQVMVYPQPDEDAAATRRRVGQSYGLTLKFPSLPEGETFTFRRTGSMITLYDGDRLDTVEAMASSLSHEYGHHYTFYHMFEQQNGSPVYEGSEYARLRGLDPEQVRANSYSLEDYLEHHAWYFYEIAAEDYVVLMGSPNSRSVEDYYDIRESINGREGPVPFARNAQVQENLMIPMANEVPGLADYFYQFVDQEAPTYEPKAIEIHLEPHSVGYDLVGGYRSFVSYEITWDKVYGEDAVYTLVCFDESDYAGSYRPIKTVTAGEEARAEIGELTIERGASITAYSDYLTEGTWSFAVTVILPDGTMHCSARKPYTF